MTQIAEARHTVATLLRDVPDTDVVAAMVRLHPNLVPDEGSRNTLRSILALLRNLTPQETTMNVVLREVEEDGERWVDVHGREMGDDTPWAIGFETWAEWLSMAVILDPPLVLPPADQLAHIVWEMTFYGATEEEIQGMWREIKGRAEEVEALLEDEEGGRT